MTQGPKGRHISFKGNTHVLPLYAHSLHLVHRTPRTPHQKTLATPPPRLSPRHPRKTSNAKPFVLGGIEDHIHIYCSLTSAISIADLASTLKSNSSKWIHENFDKTFDWQDGYAAFTMSKSADHDVIAYILNQEQHHHKKTFQEELIAFFEKFEVPYDPKYVFA